MNKLGFYIRKLTLTNGSKEDVSVEFTKGLNIISGPSDTGKSYIFESINYALGSSTQPKKITEAKGYSVILLEIVLYSGETYTLKRNLGKTKIEVYNSPIKNYEHTSSIILASKHDKEKTDNLSAFLLDKSGFHHPSFILTNKSTSNVRTLSFRDLPIYILVSEEIINKTDSPILTAQYTRGTVERAIFKLIASGIDDSDKNSPENINITSLGKFEGQIELLERLIKQEEKELEELSPIDTLMEIALEKRLEEIKEQLSNINLELQSLTDKRRVLWNRIEEGKSKKIAILELIKRFNLLKEHYESDLERLNFIREGNHYFSQLNFSLCPFCNKKLQDSGCTIGECGFDTTDNSNLTGAVEAEMNKILLHLKDLVSTIEGNEIEYEELTTAISESESEYSKVNHYISQILEPEETNLNALWDAYVVERDSLIKYNLKIAEIEDLDKEKTLIQKMHQKHSKTESKKIDHGDAAVLIAYKDICTYMENTLKRWRFSIDTNVTFEDGIFYVDFKSTKDYGKGYRAIIYSAFVISLMEYCKEKEMPHPGFVVIDSPLTTYKGKRSEEDINSDIQSAFIADLAKLNKDIQIILLENKEPHDEVKTRINFIEFTKDENEGRYGFFPFR